MSRDYVLKTVNERNIHFIRMWFTDVLGQMKSFAITPSELEAAFEEGMGFDGSSIEGFARTDESDMVAFPDVDTFQVLPWRPSDDGVARMFCDIRTPAGDPFDGDPRQVLRQELSKAADMGYSMNVGPEVEYFYFEDNASPKPIDHGSYFDLTPLDNASDLRRDTILTLEQMGIPVEYSHHEVAASQQEIDLRYSDALSMADAVMTYRLVVKEIAIKHGVYASFMPKPIEGQNGSGMHIHQSLFDTDGNNVFYDADDPLGYSLSDTAKHYIAGLLMYAPEYTLLTNQYVNSYKRLVPGYEAPVYVSWANRNRSALVRVPLYKPGKENAARFELRSPDSACNPYLAFAALLGAGLKGIEDKLELPDAVDDDIFEMSEAERISRGIKTLPANLGEATRLFADSELMCEILGEHTHHYIVQNKLQEWSQYSAHVTPWEIEHDFPIL
ncbi:MAG: glutamine synthetase family protein [Coriobacteriaceae bacterium]|nr:glutamine synthetase family protein [Coriobacteriaceae bacterium]